MTFTPNDILEREFRIRFRGYDPAEVDGFLEGIAETLAAVVKENNALKGQLAVCKTQVDELKGREAEFRDALTSAHRLVEEMKTQAAREAEILVERARLDAERIVADAHQEAVQLEERVHGLQRFQREAIIRIRSTLEGYLRILDGDSLPPEELARVLQQTATEVRAVQNDGPQGAIEGGDPTVCMEGSPARDPGGSSGPEAGGPILDFDPNKLWPSDS